ncbi:hypothetical protein TYRP_020537 [Tyrophagus putrescentiae]|nr:hypothetical protein TYRP_020537 [Tyrophagus putrescentiae]
MCSPCHPPPSRTTAFLFTPAQATLATAVVRGRGSSTVSWSSTTRAVPFLAFQSLLLLPVPAFRYDITSPPFSNTGIDLFGPVKVPMENDAKAYGVIYVCATSRLVFIDAIPDMTAQSVFTSLAHFVARNGLPRMFYSDNGKQLIKVKNDLQQYLDEMALKRPDQEFRVNWQHLTAHSPWKGGFYERLNRSIKEALATFFLDRTVSTHSIAGRVNGKKAKLSLAQLKQVLAEIEGIINNRPFFEHEGKVIRPIDFRAGQGSLQCPSRASPIAYYQKPNIIVTTRPSRLRSEPLQKLWGKSTSGHVHVKKSTSTRSRPMAIGHVTNVFDSSDGISRSAKSHSQPRAT